MPLLTLASIAAITGGELRMGRPDQTFSHFHFDSRKLRPGSLFFALPGKVHDGHTYLSRVAALPGCGAVVAREKVPPELKIPHILVDDPLAAVQTMAARLRERFRKTRFIAVTGSAGKTTTKEFIYQILAAGRPAFRSQGNWNNWIGLPFSLLMMQGREEAAVFEMAMSDPGIGEIDRLADILRPDVAVILNALPVHLEYLKTVDRVARAKCEIMGHLGADGVAVINGDYPELVQAAQEKPGRKVFFGTGPQVNSVVIREIVREERGSRITIDFFGIPRSFRAPGIHRLHAENLASAIVVCLMAGLRVWEVEEALTNLTPVEGRGVSRIVRGATVIDETYNANPAAVKRVLSWIASDWPAGAVAVLGDMLELGDQERSLHEEVGRHFAGLNFARLVAVGDRARWIAAAAEAAGFPAERVNLAATAEEAGRLLRPLVQPGVTVLFKGSRGVGLERAITEFAHE